MGALLLSFVPGIVLRIFSAIIGKMFGTSAPDTAALAQAEKDRADNAEALLKAKVQGDAIADSVRAAASAGKLREPDKFQIKP